MDPQEVTGRVLRRFSTYSRFYFIHLSWPGLSDDSLFPVIVFTDSEVRFPRVRPGDVVRVRGEMVHHYSEHYSNKCFQAKAIEVVEAWDLKNSGMFQCSPSLVKGEMAHSVAIEPASRRLMMAIQCQNDVIDRVEEYMNLVFDDPAGDFAFRKSSCAPTQGNDRLLLVHHSTGVEGPAVHEFGRRITIDPVLSYVIKRIYVFPQSSTVVGLTLEDALKLLVHSEKGEHVCRLHAYPNNTEMDRIGNVLLPHFGFHPKSFDSVLNIAFADGFYYASVVDRSVAVSCGEHISQLSDVDSLNVSKAAAKIREALVRLDKEPGILDRSDLSRKGCIDVGASPGGWSYFLKCERNAARVVSVDMGKLAEPIPQGVEHWRMKGQDAIKSLLASSEEFQFYACDMNCNPIDSMCLFLEALPLMAREAGAVITLKQTERNKEKWTEIKAACIAMLRARGSEIDLVREVHLIANTPNETTLLIGIRK